jgi:hypothetical protein
MGDGGAVKAQHFAMDGRNHLLPHQESGVHSHKEQLKKS